MKLFYLYFCGLLFVAVNGEYVKFYLHTKANKEIPQELLLHNEDSVKISNFNKTLATKIIIHGWGGSYTSSLNPIIRKAYLYQAADYNLISVDWNVYAKLNYFKARQKLPIVGQTVAEFVDFLNEKFEINFNTLVLIGHSLGAHVAGYCGKLVKRGKLSYIVGLDPALPLFSYSKPSSRLSSTDAKYVETIQTNAKVKGFWQPIGSASFYANWAAVQPGCGRDVLGKCSHARAVKLYAEAVKGYKFAPLYKCESFANIKAREGCTQVAEEGVEIGDPTQIKREEGIYNFITNSQAPFGYL